MYVEAAVDEGSCCCVQNALNDGYCDTVVVNLNTVSLEEEKAVATDSEMCKCERRRALESGVTRRANCRGGAIFTATAKKYGNGCEG